MQVLEEHFDAAFNAPDGIMKLRELILTLAMQGKLVPQDPKDQPAHELLKEIEAEKRRLVVAGKIKAPKPLPPVDADEVPYEVPQGWEWVRLGNVGVIGSSSRVHQKDWTNVGVPFYRAREIVKLCEYGYVDNELFITEGHYEMLSKDGLSPMAGDLMITGVGTIGRPYIVKKNDKFYFKDASVLIFKNHYQLSPEFLSHFLKSPITIDQMHLESMGTTVHTLTIGRANEIPLPLPPLAEQRRIVARIDELMARCDELEALGTAREQKRLDTHTAALNALLSAKAPDAFAEAWQFVAEHFGELHSAPKNVAELRRAVLQLAVMGKLVPQDPSDPPACELLKEIEAEKNRLIVAGKIRAAKLLPPVTEAEKPYQVPEGWEWVRLGEIATTRLGKMLDQSKNKGDLKPYLRNTNVQWWSIGLDDIKEMRLEKEELNEFKIEHGDLLVCEGGEPGRGAIWEYSSVEMYFQKAIHRIRPLRDVSARWILFSLQIDANTNRLDKYFTGATIKHFPREKLIVYLLPLPPLPEQHRIVAKIDQLMALCDQLEAGLAAQTGKQTELLNAVMAAVTPASTTPTRCAAPARAQAAWADPEASEPAEPKRRGRPAKVQAEESGTEGELAAPRRRGRPLKNPVAANVSIPSATSEADAIRRLEALKLERAQGARQVGLFEA